MKNNHRTYKFDVVGFGIATLDHICLQEQIAGFENISFISDINSFGGGVVPNALVTLQRLGGKSAFVTTLGNDWIGNEIISGLKKEKIDCSGINFIDNLKSPFSFIQVIKKSGNRAIAFYPGSSVKLEFTEKAKELITRSKILHLDGFNPGENLKAAKFARENGIKVMLDTNVIMEKTEELCANSDYLILPKSFLFNYTGLRSVKNALKILYNKFKTEILVATLGIEGSIALIDDNFIKVETFKHVEVKDSTGAGDVYHGAFLFGILNGWSTKDIMLFSSAVSSIKCMNYGGRYGIPNYANTIKFLKNNNKEISTLAKSI